MTPPGIPREFQQMWAANNQQASARKCTPIKEEHHRDRLRCSEGYRKVAPYANETSREASLGSINSSSNWSLGSLWEADYGRRLERYRSFGSVPWIGQGVDRTCPLSTSKSCGALVRRGNMKNVPLNSSSDIDWKMSDMSLLADDDCLLSEDNLVRLEPDSLNISSCSSRFTESRAPTPGKGHVKSTSSDRISKSHTPRMVQSPMSPRRPPSGEDVSCRQDVRDPELQRSPKRTQLGYSRDSLEPLGMNIKKEVDTPRTLSLDSVTLDECLLLLHHDNMEENMERPESRTVRRSYSDTSAKRSLNQCQCSLSFDDDEDVTISSGSTRGRSSRTTFTQTDAGRELVLYKQNSPPDPSAQSLLWEIVGLMKLIAQGPAFQGRCACPCNGAQLRQDDQDLDCKCSRRVYKHFGKQDEAVVRGRQEAEIWRSEEAEERTRGCGIITRCFLLASLFLADPV